MKGIFYVLGILLILGFSFYITLENISITGYAPAQNLKELTFRFENPPSEIMEGRLFFGDKNIGKWKNNYYIVKVEEIENLPDRNESLCFEGKIELGLLEIENWTINRCWNSTKESLLSDYKKGYTSFSLNFSETDLRAPVGKEVQNFVRLEDVENLTDGKKEIEDYWDIIEFMSFIGYAKDGYWTGFDEYWKLPLETLTDRKGDCEDYSLTLLSLLRSKGYDCYGVKYESHLGVFCYYGQGEFEFLDNEVSIKRSLSLNTTQDIENHREKIENALYMYYNYYGLDTNERRVRSVFNEKEYYSFSETENFIDWVLFELVRLKE